MSLWPEIRDSIRALGNGVGGMMQYMQNRKEQDKVGTWVAQRYLPPGFTTVQIFGKLTAVSSGYGKPLLLYPTAVLHTKYNAKQQTGIQTRRGDYNANDGRDFKQEGRITMRTTGGNEQEMVDYQTVEYEKSPMYSIHEYDKSQKKKPIISKPQNSIHSYPNDQLSEPKLPVVQCPNLTKQRHHIHHLQLGQSSAQNIDINKKIAKARQEWKKALLFFSSREFRLLNNKVTKNQTTGQKW